MTTPADDEVTCVCERCGEQLSEEDMDAVVAAGYSEPWCQPCWKGYQEAKKAAEKAESQECYGDYLHDLYRDRDLERGAE